MTPCYSTADTLDIVSKCKKKHTDDLERRYRNPVSRTREHWFGGVETCSDRYCNFSEPLRIARRKYPSGAS